MSSARDTASLTAVAPSTSMHSGSPPARPSRAGKRPLPPAAMRTVCSASWLSTWELHPPPRHEKSRAAPQKQPSTAAPAPKRAARSGTDIPQPPPGRKSLRSPAGQCQRQARPSASPASHQPRAASRGLHAGVAGPLSSSAMQPGSRHRDARRGQRDEQPVHCQHQLIQPHPRPAQRVGQPDAQPHASQPQHHVRAGKQRRVLKITLPHPAPPPAPERAFTVPAYARGFAKHERRYGLFPAHFLWYS